MNHMLTGECCVQVKWYAWLEEQIKSGISVTEYEAAEELTNFRAEGEHFWGLAYENISASGPNAGMWFSLLILPDDGMLTN